MSELACLDGTVAPAEETLVPATDEGLLRGDGAFEVIRIYDGVAFALDDHLERLANSCANLKLEMADAELLRDEVLALVTQRAERYDGLIRVVLTRGGRRLILTEPLPAGSGAASIALGVVTYSPTRILDGIKSLSYAGNMLASRTARERGFDDALLVTPHGRVLEAPTSSIFWVDQHGTICTPSLEEHILASITRARVLGLVDVDERPATLDDLRAASEAFITSTTREVQAIATIDDIHLPSAPGERTSEAAAAPRHHIAEALRALRA